MIVPSSSKVDQAHERLRLKNAEAAFAGQIVRGTNCSPFESQIIVEKAKEAFRIGQWAEGHVLLDGQIVFHALSAQAPPGMPLEQCPKVRLVLSVLRRHEDLEVLRKHGAAAKRRQQLARIAVEAREQGGLLTQEDLGLVLGCDVRTIRSDVQALRDRDVVVPTRGTVQDIGPGVTHKHQAIDLWLGGQEALEVARHLNHSLRAVERYIQTFCRVVYAQRRLRNILATALVVGISVPAAHLYWDLHQELSRKSFYRQRLDEVLRLGELHWEASDGKKSLPPRLAGREA